MRPPVWQLVKDAVQELGGEASYSAIKQQVWSRYPDVNASTLTCQIIICSVNHPSRIHYPENKKPRLCTSQYDFLYNTARGRVATYDPQRHGVWEIAADSDGRLSVRLAEQEGGQSSDLGQESEGAQGTFALESHLRDYLARNLATIPDFGAQLALFVDPDGRDGVEYQTDVGPIDILAKSDAGDFYVFELKLGRGPDAALGQILRYMGWVEKHLAKDGKVFGVVLASNITEKLRYAATQVPQVRLMEYELRLSFKPVRLS